jgi:hypothetical protein
MPSGHPMSVFQGVGASAPISNVHYYWVLAPEEIRSLNKGVGEMGTISLSTFNFQLSTFSVPRGPSCP